MTRLLLHQRALCEGGEVLPMPHAQHVLRRTHTLMFMLRHHLTIMLCRHWVDCPNWLQTCQSISVNVLPEWTTRLSHNINNICRPAECWVLYLYPDSKLDVQTGNSALHTQYNTIGWSCIQKKNNTYKKKCFSIQQCFSLSVDHAGIFTSWFSYMWTQRQRTAEHRWSGQMTDYGIFYVVLSGTMLVLINVIGVTRVNHLRPTGLNLQNLLKGLRAACQRS